MLYSIRQICYNVNVGIQLHFRLIKEEININNVIHADFIGDKNKSRAINVSSVKRSARKINAGLIAPPVEDTDRELASEHSAEPIKSMDDILRISAYLLNGERYRDNMLFVLGINFGLRISDLRTLRFCDLITDDFAFRERFSVLEKKTKNTRKNKQNRYITINNAVMDAVTMYLEHTSNVTLSDYLFRSESNRGKNVNAPLDPKSVDRILKGIASDLGLGIRFSSHSLRKTFGYHQMMMSGNDPRKLLLLQKMFGHSTSMQTLTYIGITDDEISEAYLSLNLGSDTEHYLIDSQIVVESNLMA